MKKNRAKKICALLLAFSFAASLACTSLPAHAQNEGSPIPGIDVWRGQGAIDWNTVKSSGIQFAMIRDGYGGTPGEWDNQKDERFEENYAGATAAGIKVGVYHYSDALDTTMASNEADECLSILNHRHLDYPVAYDVEDPKQYGLSSAELGQIVQTFCSKIEQAGYTTIVYSFKNFFLSHLDNPLVYSYDAWVAQYGASSPSFADYTMWQYTSSGSVPGISGRCDMDYSYVDYSTGGGGHGMDPMTFNCDTPAYTFGTNLNYTYRITTPDTEPPTAVSSNPSAVAVSEPTATYRGYLFTLKNVGAGDATITTTAADGRSVSFTATGTGKAANTLLCDTSSYAFGPGKYAYTYKITTNDSTVPTAASSDNSVVTVSYSKPTAGGYLFTIKNAGVGTANVTTTAADGSSVSFPVTGAAAAVTPQATLRCDTSSYAFGPGRNVYTYLITTDASAAPAAKSSDTSVVTVAYLKKVSGGYLYTIKNAGAGSANVTTTAADGSSVSFPVTGAAAAVTPQTVLRCDTSSYAFGPGKYVYTYKITTGASSGPVAKSSDASVVTVAYAGKTTGGYLYRITNAGAGTATVTTTAADGSSVSFPVTGAKPGDALSMLKSDTPYNFSMKKGAYYQYRFTGDQKTAYSFSGGNGSIMSVVSIQKKSGSYYVKVRTVARGQVGLYAFAGGRMQKVGIITVS